MKFLLFLIAVFVLLWMLRGSWRRARRPPAAPPPSQAPPVPQTILACAQCGLHLPRDDALPGRGGVFCSSAHRAAFEETHPER